MSVRAYIFVCISHVFVLCLNIAALEGQRTMQHQLTLRPALWTISGVQPEHLNAVRFAPSSQLMSSFA